MNKVRTAVLISGRGSNMMALVEASRAPAYPAEIVCVVSNNADAPGLDFARANGIEAKVIDHRTYASREAFEAELDDYLCEKNIQLVALAGFMRLLSGGFIADWPGRILNIHPSLLPAYKGLHTHERALADGAKVHGCTVHVVTADLDAGPIIAQAEVAVLPDDTSHTLSARVLEQEHRIYPEALARIANEIDKLDLIEGDFLVANWMIPFLPKSHVLRDIVMIILSFSIVTLLAILAMNLINEFVGVSILAAGLGILGTRYQFRALDRGRRLRKFRNR